MEGFFARLSEGSEGLITALFVGHENKKISQISIETFDSGKNCFIAIK